MELDNTAMGIMVIVLGGLLAVSGIGLVVVLLREKKWWEGLVIGGLAMPLPDFGMGGMMPMIQQMVQELLKKVFRYIRIVTLLGGAGVSTLGVVLILIGIYIVS